MIVRDFFKQREDGIKLFRTYSDKNYIIQKVGTDEKYSDAIDIETALFEYIETDELIKEEQPLEILETIE